MNFDVSIEPLLSFRILHDNGSCACLQIGADGFKSLVRKAANIHTLQWAYNQSAVVAVLKLNEVTTIKDCQ